MGSVRLAVVAAALTVSVGCAGASSATGEDLAGPTTIDPAELESAPSDAGIEVRAGGSVETVSVAELEALGMARIEVYEPFVGADTLFEGPLFRDVVAGLGLPADGVVELVALDDFRLTDEVSALLASEAVLATRERGEPIPVEAGGPARLVFPDGSELASELEAWIWSLASIEAQ